MIIAFPPSVYERVRDIDDQMLLKQGIGGEVVGIARLNREPGATEFDEVDRETKNKVYYDPIEITGQVHSNLTAEQRARYGTDLNIDFMAVFSVRELLRAGLYEENINIPGRFEVLITEDDVCVHRHDRYSIERVRVAHQHGGHPLRIQVLGRKDVAADYYVRNIRGR